MKCVCGGKLQKLRHNLVMIYLQCLIVFPSHRKTKQQREDEQ
jgi:hypothetical protein